KIYATPTWGLYSASICCLVFAALYWVMDVKKRTRWANFLTPAGENPLLVYILPGIAFSLLGLSNITLLDDYAGSGGARIARAAILAVALVQLGGFLGKRRVRLRL